MGVPDKVPDKIIPDEARRSFSGSDKKDTIVMTNSLENRIRSVHDLQRLGLSLVDTNSGDADEIVRIYRAYRKTTYSTSKIRKILDSHPSCGIRLNNTLIGFCYTEFFAPDIIEVSSVFVVKEWRNKGLGALLLARVHSDAASRGYKAAILSNSMLYETREPKIRAEEFYVRAGYQKILHTDHTDVFAVLLTPPAV